MGVFNFYYIKMFLAKKIICYRILLSVGLIFAILSFLQINKVKADDVSLNTNGTSHLYWPFPNSTAANHQDSTTGADWAIRGYGHGDSSNPGDHFGSDFYAEDWGLPSNSDLGKEFKAPFDGTIIFARSSTSGYGNTVLL